MHTNTHDSSEYFRIYDEGETIVPMREYSADVYEVRPVSCEDRDQALPYRNMHTGQFPISFQCHCLPVIGNLYLHFAYSRSFFSSHITPNLLWVFAY